MRRLVFTALVILGGLNIFAQSDTGTISRRAPSVTLPRSNDHFMFQIGYTSWQGKPDSIHTSGLPRSINLYFLFDYPFKTNPHLSTAIGAGIATDNIYFDETYVGIKDNTATLRFQDQSDTSHFKKYKLASTFAEVPIELRYTFKPEDQKGSWKLALGIKVGTLLNVHTKGKTLQNKNNANINNYTEKESRKTFFNSTRLAATARVGIGNFSLFGAYSLTGFLKDVAGPTIRPFQVGICISGL